MHGFDRITASGNCLLVGYHSRCTVDLVYALVNIQPSIIATYLMFKVPFMSGVLAQFNFMPSGSNGKAEMGFISALSGSKRPLLLLPGGVYECLKPLAQVGKLQWKDVPGFARIIHQEQEHLGSKTKVIPFHTKNCEKVLFRSDFIYETCGNLSSVMYSAFKRGHYYFLPVMLTLMFMSIGLKFVPRPVKLDTFFGEPVILQPGESAEAFAARIATAAQDLVDRVEALPESKVPMPYDGGAVETLLFWGTGTYTALQNCVVIAFILFMIWLPVIAGTYVINILFHLCV